MPRFIRTLLVILLWIILLGGGFVVFWVRDANLSPAPMGEPLNRDVRQDRQF